MTYRKRWLLAGLPLLALCGSFAMAAAKKPEPQKDAKAAPAAAGAPEAGVVATVDGEKITDRDIMTSLPPDRQKGFQGAMQRIQDIERQAVQEILAAKYVEEQAKAKGISEDEYYAQEVAANRDSFSTAFKTQLSQVKQQIYDAKRAVVDEVIAKKLEEKAARSKGVTVEALVKAEVEDKIVPVTPADIDQYYTQNQRQFGGQAKEAVTKQIEDAIKNQRITQKRNELRASLRSSAAIRTYLEVPRIPVSLDDDPIQGSRNAPIQIVEFSDFQ